MKNSKAKIFLALSAILLPLLTLSAQTKQTLAVANVKINSALEKRVETMGRVDTLKRIAESMTELLTSDFSASNKFQMVSSSDIDSLIAEQNLSESGNVDRSDESRAKVGEFKGAKYILAVNIIDFQDYSKSATLKELEKTVDYRELRLGVIGNIIDSSTREIIASSRFTLEKEFSSDNDLQVAQNSRPSDVLISELASEASRTMTDALVDYLYPAKVLSKSGEYVFLNRGTGSSIKPGDIFKIMALSQDLIDPDTGENLGKGELVIGQVVVDAVYAKYSRARVLQDKGIDAGQIARMEKLELR